MEKALAQRAFGKTGRKVSVLGLGTVKFGRNQGVKYPGGEGFRLPEDREISSIIDLCRERGINLLDTAPAYGTAEERLGSIFGKRRDDFFIITKTGEEFEGGASRHDFSETHTVFSVERSLRRLKTDRLDCVLVHSSRDDVHVINNTPVIEVLTRLKEAGKILSFGVSTYTVEGGRLAADMSDAVMVAYNPGYPDEAPAIDYAAGKGCAVLVKKGLASGHAAGDAAGNIRFVLENSGVTSMVFGSLSPANILANINAALGCAHP